MTMADARHHFRKYDFPPPNNGRDCQVPRSRLAPKKSWPPKKCGTQIPSVRNHRVISKPQSHQSLLKQPVLFRIRIECRKPATLLNTRTTGSANFSKYFPANQPHLDGNPTEFDTVDISGLVLTPFTPSMQQQSGNSQNLNSIKAQPAARQTCLSVWERDACYCTKTKPICFCCRLAEFA